MTPSLRDQLQETVGPLAVGDFEAAVRRGRRLRNQRRAVQVAAAAMAAVLVVAMAVMSGNSRTESTGPATPGSEPVRHLDRPDLGFSVDVPATWIDTARFWRGLDFGWGDRNYFVLGAGVRGAPANLDAAADWWVQRVSSFGGRVLSRHAGALDGRPVEVVIYESRQLGRRLAAVSYVFRSNSGRYDVVGVGWDGEGNHTAVTDRVASTIDLH